MRRVLTVVVAVVTAIVMTGGADATPAKHVRTYDKNLLKYVNNARVSHGLKPFKESARLYAVAHKWAEHLATTHQLGDDPNWVGGTRQWRKVCPHATTAGANDGWQGKSSARQMFEQYKAEPYHWANMQSPRYNPAGQPAYTDVGIATIAVKNSDGTTSEWNSMYFANHCG